MKGKFVAALTLALFSTMLIAGVPVSAQRNSKYGVGLTVPFTASGFSNGGTADVTGTISITKFANQGGKLVAIGTLAATVPDLTGVHSVVTQVTMPVSNISMSGGSTATSAVALQAATCGILHLELGPLDLDLLGLLVHLDKVVLDISAEQGSGNLLGNLLCSIAGLLDSGPLSQILDQLVDLLNQIIAVL